MSLQDYKLSIDCQLLRYTFPAYKASSRSLSCQCCSYYLLYMLPQSSAIHSLLKHLPEPKECLLLLLVGSYEPALLCLYMKDLSFGLKSQLNLPDVHKLIYTL